MRLEVEFQHLVDTAINILTDSFVEIVVSLFVGSLGGGSGLERRINGRFVVDNRQRSYLDA